MNDTRINLSGASILVVDDVPANLGVLIPILENVGYQVQVATSGEQGLEIAARSLPDLVLLDVMMPGIDGFETCRQLKKAEATREIPVVFLTASDELSGVVEGFQAGGVDYVTKPFQQEEVLARIQTHLERALMTRELMQKNRDLADLNAHLQQKVEDRTRELWEKVKALEDRDRIAQQLLAVHKLHDTLTALASADLFQGLDAPALRSLAEEVEWVFLPSGERLIQQGDPADTLYIVLNGRLRVVVRQPDGQDTTVSEIGRGEYVGEMAILTEETRSASVDTIRDSNLIKVSKTAFNRFKEQYPHILEEIIQLLIRRIRRGDEVRATSRRTTRGTTVALVPAGGGVPLADFAVRLTGALARTDSTLHLNADRLDAYLGQDTAQTPQTSLENRSIVAWLNTQEASKRFIVYEADPSPSAWTARCIRQADRILIVGRAGADPEPGAIETAMLNEDSPNTVRKELVLFHPDANRRPVDTGRWLAHRSVAAHHHIRLSEQADFERLARVLSGQTVGLVLGGGAARGFAHIGVIRALKDHGIPIDAIGGTSMGSVVAAQYALGLDYKAMLAATRKGWVDSKPFTSYTFPMVALLTDRKVNAMLRAMFGDIRVEDLWLNYFSMSSSLTRAEANVHSNGLLWKGVRASISIPVALPPLLEGGDMYVDGVLLNNLPTDVMRQFCDGYVIASDTSVGVEEKEANRPDYETLSGWRLLFNRLNPFSTTESVPSLMHVVMRSVELNSVRRTRVQKREADFYLRPPIEGFGRFAWDTLEQIAEAGYTYTMEEIGRWQSDDVEKISSFQRK